MKKYLIILTLTMSFLLAGCIFIIEETYTFCQDSDQIESIEILKKEYESVLPDGPVEVLKTLDVSEHQQIIDDLLAADGSRNGLNPATSFGSYILRITYQDSEIEIIGNYNNGYISQDGVLRYRTYQFDRVQFYDIISRYLGEEVTEPRS